MNKRLKKEIRKEYCIQEALEYLIETEADDFADNPSEDHAYFKAYVGLGYDDPEGMLAEAIRDLEALK